MHDQGTSIPDIFSARKIRLVALVCQGLFGEELYLPPSWGNISSYRNMYLEENILKTEGGYLRRKR